LLCIEANNDNNAFSDAMGVQSNHPTVAKLGAALPERLRSLLNASVEKQEVFLLQDIEIEKLKVSIL
jgi:hypothetical protein